ncbi:PAS domain-containing protein [Methylocystis sp. SB2]|uniref:PAS domain-containing protein n=1 Tax=Methylocystis sp. (strain SB2) TaxID=743836 RepID=UPI001EFA2E5B|nr:PAS domain-containing protein [Methylocystis sp. SB2]ULO24392.1 PAS domain-containing protein [Methylocystis sp. SB2]
MRLSVSRELHDYWGRLKGERAAPDRAEIDPVAICHILPDIFIIEVDPKRRLPLRLCGARVNALWQREQKGRLFLDWWRAPRQEAMAEAILPGHRRPNAACRTRPDSAVPGCGGTRTPASASASLR